MSSLVRNGVITTGVVILAVALLVVAIQSVDSGPDNCSSACFVFLHENGENLIAWSPVDDSEMPIRSAEDLRDYLRSLER